MQIEYVLYYTPYQICTVVSYHRIIVFSYADHLVHVFEKNAWLYLQILRVVLHLLIFDLHSSSSLTFPLPFPLALPFFIYPLNFLFLFWSFMCTFMYTTRQSRVGCIYCLFYSLQSLLILNCLRATNKKMRV
ncbi:hypothetical protein BCR41DRAFT_67105 [Lobosporangium transversale]|uniref:Uncharacterized protein n=1 Tax=Lobosporangium transversale TaxID=64571 RepID=A0A1Y2H0N5_9FUNG|nr:hypothetical protein BCR41DRAFT_67105 [Lobosporangium transversale]ORZ28120.1 hypothetical protein BCR41DRAFT_67105 [Lobosporangium transversale]|eukprot:XP_021885805.1 hypothetical protein BCR41DRAFT_67105 [Lobosporangium transversale]